MQYLSFCISVISCSIRSSSFIHVVPCLRMSFLFSGWIIFHCIHVIWSLCHWGPQIVSLFLPWFILSKCPQIGFLSLTLPWPSLGSDHCGLPQQPPEELCAFRRHLPTLQYHHCQSDVPKKKTIPLCHYWRSQSGLKFRLLGRFKGSKFPDFLLSM